MRNKNLVFGFLLSLMGGAIQTLTIFLIIVSMLTELTLTLDSVLILPVVWIFSNVFLLEGWRRIWL